MGASENFCLRWNDFEANVSSAFRELRAESDFFDVTLVCDDSGSRTLQAHRVILSACSPFFKQMLRTTAVASPGHPNPLVYLRGVRFHELESILDFIYHGEVNVAQEDLKTFLGVAEDLQIKGLTQQSTKHALGGRRATGRKSAASSGGPAGKRARRVHDDDDDDVKESVNVKNEPSGFEGAAAAGSASTTEVTTGEPFDEGNAAGSGTYGEETYDDGYGYEGGEAGGDDSALIQQGISGTPSAIEGTDNAKAVTDLNELVMGLLTYSDGIHSCTLCGKKSPWRTTMLRHVEANHVETAGHVCDICGQVSKTRHAFAMHKKRKHKVNMANEPLPDRSSQPVTPQQGASISSA